MKVKLNDYKKCGRVAEKKQIDSLEKDGDFSRIRQRTSQMRKPNWAQFGEEVIES